MPIPVLRTSTNHSHQMFIEDLLSTRDGTHAGGPEISATGRVPALMGVCPRGASGAEAHESMREQVLSEYNGC